MVIDREVDAFEALKFARDVSCQASSNSPSLSPGLVFYLGKAIVLALLHVATRIEQAGRQ